MISIEAFNAITKVLAVGGIICTLIIVVLLFDLFTKRRLRKLIHRWGKWLMVLVVFVSMCITLFFSEMLGFIPCGLCWFERMFLYPQLVVVLVGIYTKDKLMPYYTLFLSAVGFVFALYHHSLQISVDSSLPCPASGGDCSSAIMVEFGFITFPLLAAIAFAFLFAISFYLTKTNSDQ